MDLGAGHLTVIVGTGRRGGGGGGGAFANESFPQPIFSNTLGLPGGLPWGDARG